ncbi:MAG: PA14 domain-containing protein, partial [Phycisphaerae bacterium]
MSKKLIYLVSFVFVLCVVGVASGTEGLKGEYYYGNAGNPWQTLVMERIDPTVDFSWGDGSPDPSMRSDDFTVRWTGMIEVPATDTYTFHTETDDGVRLFVNGQRIIHNWTDHSVTHNSGDIALIAGQKYEFILEWYERGGGAVCELSWSTPSLTRETVPSRYFSPERPYARRPDPPDGAILRDTWVSISWAPGDFAVSHDVYLGENFDDVNDGAPDSLGFLGNQPSANFVIGFPGFPYPDGLVPGKTYYWRIDEVDESNPESPWKGPVWSFSIAPRTAFSPDPADGAESVDPNGELYWEPGLRAVLHHIYFGDNFADVNEGTPDTYKGPMGFTEYTPGTLELGKAYYWRVDEFDSINTYKGDVWGFSTPGAVLSVYPRNGAVDIRQTLILKWSPGDSTASHQVYFGTDKDAVRNANTGSPEYKGSRDLGSESYDPGKLQWDTTYYWRVDGVDNANPDSPWVGLLWSFTTANFLIVDDFELYNDLDPHDPESNRIFNAWIDGYGIPTNGSIVGYGVPPFVEQTIVHGGNQ